MAGLEVARQQWEEGYRRVQRFKDDPRYPQVMELVDLLVEELRKRLGSVFTLEELAGSYRRADDWARQRIDLPEAPPVWPSWLATALDSAFHLYARSARDFKP